MKKYRTPRTFGVACLPFDPTIAAKVIGEKATEFFMCYGMLHVYHGPCFAWNEV